MTSTTEILRHAEDDPRLCAGFLFERLAILEDRRRVSEFQRARPALDCSLATMLAAFRPICGLPEIVAYAHDMQALAGSDVSDVDVWLRDSAFQPDAMAIWYSHAE